MIVVTGGAGFIGSCFLWKLNQEGIRDIVVVDDLDGTEKWKNLYGKSFRDYFQKDQFLEKIKGHKLPRPKMVIHLGACSSTTETDSDFLIRNNFEYSKIMAEWALSHKARFIYASSAATYGDGGRGYSDSEEEIYSLRPLNMYGFSKQLFDMWVLEHGLIGEVTGIKYFNIFGPNEWHKGDMRSVICKAFPGVKAEGKIKLFRSYRDDCADGEQKRDFVYVKDAVEVMYFFFNNTSATGIFNLGAGEARSWNDVAAALFSALGKRPVIEYIDMPETIREKYQYFTQADIGKLRNAGCDHVFSSLEDAVKDYSGYLARHKYL